MNIYTNIQMERKKHTRMSHDWPTGQFISGIFIVGALNKEQYRNCVRRIQIPRPCQKVIVRKLSFPWTPREQGAIMDVKSTTSTYF
jgi:hypothetical protein